MQRPRGIGARAGEAAVCFGLGVGIAILASFGMRALDEHPGVAATMVAARAAPVADLDEDGEVGGVAEIAPHSEVAIATPGARPGEPLGSFRFTRYYVAEESRFPAGDAVTIYDDRACTAIAAISHEFARALDMEGTGRLRDGRTINVSTDCRCGRSPCYRTTDADSQWGVGVRDLPLAPFRTVAVDPSVVPIGTALYVPELDGLTMPGPAPWGGFVHDGCVVAVDVGARVRGHQVDFFVGRRLHMEAFDARWHLERVTLLRGGGRCRRFGTGTRTSGT